MAVIDHMLCSILNQSCVWRGGAGGGVGFLVVFVFGGRLQGAGKNIF